MSSKILLYQEKIVNCILTDNEQKELKDCSSKLLSLACSIYSKKKKLNKYVEISQSINYITCCSIDSVSGNIKDKDGTVLEKMNILSKHLKKVDYSKFDE